MLTPRRWNIMGSKIGKFWFRVLWATWVVMFNSNGTRSRLVAFLDAIMFPCGITGNILAKNMQISISSYGPLVWVSLISMGRQNASLQYCGQHFGWNRKILIPWMDKYARASLKYSCPKLLLVGWCATFSLKLDKFGCRTMGACVILELDGTRNFC